MTPQTIRFRRRSFGSLLRAMGSLFGRSKTAKTDVSRSADVPDYLRADVGLLPQTRRMRTTDPPQINPYKLF